MSNKFKMKSKKPKVKAKEELSDDTGFLAGKQHKSKSTAQSFGGKTTKSFSTKKV